MRTALAISLGFLLGLATSAGEAGVVTLRNGTTFQGTPVGESLLVSTGQDLLEFSPEAILSVKPEEIRLKDGRVITGTIVGGRLRFKTDLGEVAVALTDLAEYRESAGGAPPTAKRSAPTSSPGAASPPPPPEPAQSAPPSPAPSVVLSRVPSPPAPAPVRGRLFQVRREAVVYHDAAVQAGQVGVVRQGEIVTYVDMIDRRLTLWGYTLDFGNWRRVKTASGVVGWVEADALQEVREGASAQQATP
jgi:hypothetical protein